MQKRGGMVGGGGQRDMPPARMQYWSKASRDLELRAERKPVVTERMASISFWSWGGSVAVAAVVTVDNCHPNSNWQNDDDDNKNSSTRSRGAQPGRRVIK